MGLLYAQTAMNFGPNSEIISRKAQDEIMGSGSNRQHAVILESLLLIFEIDGIELSVLISALVGPYNKTLTFFSTTIQPLLTVRGQSVIFFE